MHCDGDGIDELLVTEHHSSGRPLLSISTSQPTMNIFSALAAFLLPLSIVGAADTIDLSDQILLRGLGKVRVTPKPTSQSSPPPTSRSTPPPTAPTTSTTCCSSSSLAYATCMSGKCNRSLTACSSCKGTWIAVPIVRNGCCAIGGSNDCSGINPAGDPKCQYLETDCISSACNGVWKLTGATSNPTKKVRIQIVQ
jgi:hypothetical protein